MFDNKRFKISLAHVENEEFEVPNRFKEFIIEAMDIEGCVRELDKRLYEYDVSGHLNDFSDHYNHDGTQCRVSFGDSECGLTINFTIEEA